MPTSRHGPPKLQVGPLWRCTGGCCYSGRHLQWLAISLSYNKTWADRVTVGYGDTFDGPRGCQSNRRPLYIIKSVIFTVRVAKFKIAPKVVFGHQNHSSKYYPSERGSMQSIGRLNLPRGFHSSSQMCKHSRQEGVQFVSKQIIDCLWTGMKNASKQGAFCKILTRAFWDMATLTCFFGTPEVWISKFCIFYLKN